MTIDPERLKELHRQLFMILTTINDIQTQLDKIRSEVYEADTKIIEKLDTDQGS